MDSTSKSAINNIRLGVVKNRAQVEWIAIEKIMPNPHNPRQSDAVKTAELQDILRTGWEVPVTGYWKNSARNMVVLLSGHRRLYAARELGIRELPVFLVEAPATMEEEILRIGRAQTAQEDWSTFEWAKYIHQRWVAWGKPGVKEFAKEMKKPFRTVESYIRVLEYYPLPEIETGVVNGSFSFSNLFDLIIWIRKLKKIHGELVQQMGEDLIRKFMVEKLLSKKVHRDSLRQVTFLEMVKPEDIRRLMVDRNLSLDGLMDEYEFDAKEKSFHAQLVGMGFAKKSVKKLRPRNLNEAEKAYETLKEMQDSIKGQLEYIQRAYPKAIQNEWELFNDDK